MLFRKIIQIKQWVQKPQKQIKRDATKFIHQQDWNEILEENEYLNEVNEELLMRVRVQSFMLTCSGIYLGWLLNKTYHWF